MTSSLNARVAQGHNIVDTNPQVTEQESTWLRGVVQEMQTELRSGRISAANFATYENVKKINELLGRLDLDGDGKKDEKLVFKDGRVQVTHNDENAKAEKEFKSFIYKGWNSVKHGDVEVTSLDKIPTVQTSDGEIKIPGLGTIKKDHTSVTSDGTIHLVGDKGTAEVRQDKTVIARDTKGEVYFIAPGEKHAKDGHTFEKQTGQWIEKDKDGNPVGTADRIKDVREDDKGNIVVENKDGSSEVRRTDGSIIKYDAQKNVTEIWTSEGHKISKEGGKWIEKDANEKVVNDSIKNVEVTQNGDIVIQNNDNSFEVRKLGGPIIKYDQNGSPREVWATAADGSQIAATKNEKGEWVKIDPATGKAKVPEESEPRVSSDDKGSVKIESNEYPRDSVPKDSTFGKPTDKPGGNQAGANNPEGDDSEGDNSAGKPGNQRRRKSPNEGERRESTDQTVKGDRNREYRVNKDGSMGYTIKSNDTLWSIATEIYKLMHPDHKGPIDPKEISKMVEKIKETSKIKHAGKIWPGDEITIPDEYARHIKGAQSQQPAAKPATGDTGSHKQVTQQADANQRLNNAVTLLKDLQTLDNNGDGRVTRDEIDRAKNGHEDEKIRRKYDDLLAVFDVVKLADRNANTTDLDKESISKSDADAFIKSLESRERQQVAQPKAESDQSGRTKSLLYSNGDKYEFEYSGNQISKVSWQSANGKPLQFDINPNATGPDELKGVVIKDGYIVFVQGDGTRYVVLPSGERRKMQDQTPSPKV